MTQVSRRHFMRVAGAWAAGLAGLQSFYGCAELSAREGGGATAGYGELVSDPNGVIDLPRGFGYTRLSPTGAKMDDGFLVPGAHDGMAAFPGPDGLTILVRNHEMTATRGGRGSPFGPGKALLANLPRGASYDLGVEGSEPCIGGTTTLVYDTKAKRLRGQFLSLTGTVRNCAGGPTPWGSWVSCEETVERAGSWCTKDHGWNFEVPAAVEPGIAPPRPLTAMGRFNHEAIAVDPASGCVYQTEDRHDSLIYRFVPERKGELAAGGRLQALVVVGREKLDTRNWDDRQIERGEKHAVRWIDMDGVESPEDDLRHRGRERGGAIFARGEGMWWGRDAIYFMCTIGGPNEKGQVFRYTPSEHEGDAARETKAPATLELFVEPDDRDALDMGDNLTVTPWGDLLLCEDGRGDQYVVGVTPEGDLYHFARNAANRSELAGATFSPDATTLFVNVQSPGYTLAITGPWQEARKAAKKRRLH